MIVKGLVDKDILELRLSSLKELCSEKEGSLRSLKGQQRLTEDAAELRRPGLEVCRKISRMLDHWGWMVTRSTVAACCVTVAGSPMRCP